MLGWLRVATKEHESETRFPAVNYRENQSSKTFRPYEHAQLFGNQKLGNFLIRNFYW